MQRVSTFIDFIIYDFFIFIVLLIFFGSFTNGYFPLALSIVGLLFFSAIFFRVRKKMFSKKKLASESVKQLKLIETSLLYQTNSECLQFFSRFFASLQGLELSPCDNFLIGGETVVYPCFFGVTTTFTELLKASKIAREKGAKHLILPCIKNVVDIDFLSNMFDAVSVFESYSLYEKMLEFDFFPTMIDEKVLPKKSFKSLFSPLLNRKKARSLGFLGLILFAFSFLSPFKTYYLISAGIVLALSASVICFSKIK